MNTTKYLQTDSRWSGLGYPRNPCTIGNSGCGEVAIVNSIIEMQKYAKYTPATIVGYARQYAAPNCDGTYWSGIPAMMKNYGLTEVKEHATMPELFKELAKGERVAIYLMGSRRGGSKGVHWTSSGHFICSTSYRYRNGEHEVYVKDSYSNSSLRNGWLGYSTHLKGDVLKVWSGKLTGKLYDGSTAEEVKGTNKLDLDNGKLTVDGIGGKATVRAMQKFFGTTQDGIISGQNKNLARYYPSLQSVQYGKGGSPCIKKLQTWCSLPDPDGIIGSNTTKGWQRKLQDLGYLAPNETIDGIFGVKSMKAWQECLNNNGKKKESKPAPTPTPTPTKKGYTGTFPDIKLVKTNAEVKRDAVTWAKWIANGISFHYGYGKHSHHNGCYFCDTQYLKKGHGIKEYKTTYCCNPFVGAAWAHGGGDATAYKMCHNCDSWDFGTGKGSYHSSTLFNKLGHPAKSKLQPGDVLCNSHHVMMYIGDGKIAEARTEDDNVVGSSSWKNSISISTLSNSRYDDFPRVYRYNGKVNTTRVLSNGEVSDRVADLQRYLDWYFDGKVGSADGIFGSNTLKWTKEFQERELGKGQGDGLVGQKTIDAMKKVKK